MTSRDDQPAGQTRVWGGPRRRYYPVRPGAGPDPSSPQGPEPSVAEGPGHLVAEGTGPLATGLAGRGGRAPDLGAPAAGAPGLGMPDMGMPDLVMPDMGGTGVPRADLASTVLAVFGVVDPPARAPATTAMWPARRRVDTSVLTPLELRREASTCVDENPGRAKRVIIDWLRS